MKPPDTTYKARRYTPRQHERAARAVEENAKLARAFVLRVMRIPPDNPLHDDAVQEMLCVLWRCALGFDPTRGHRFSTYAYGSMFRYSRRFWRTHGRHGFTQVGDRRVPPPASLRGLRDVLPEPAGRDAADRAEVDAAVGRLAGRLRRVVRARMDGLHPRTVGIRLGLTQAEVQRLEGAALRQLRRELA